VKRRHALKYCLLLLTVAACTEQPLAPGVCPDFCPGAQIEIHDTLFATVIERDSSFRGYLQAYQGDAMTATDVPGVVDSRPFFTTDTMFARIQPVLTDTTTVPKVIDSVRVRFVVVRWPRNTTNLRLKLYRLPVNVDTTTDFASLDPYFTAPPVDSLNIYDLLAIPAIGDTQTIRLWGDSIRVDSAGHVLQISQGDSALAVYFKLDTLRAPFSEADTGRSAWGVRVAADSNASMTVGSTQTGARSPLVRWFYHYTIPDTVSTKPDSVASKDKVMPNRFDSFVFDPPTPPDDSNLAVGGVPSARAVVRVNMPKFLHDSIDIVRATLLLVPVSAPQGAPIDSFYVVARPVLGDLGAKSPVNPASSLADSAIVRIGSADTVRIELTSLFSAWSRDSTAVTTFVLEHSPEASSYTEVRFYSSRTPAYRPAVRITYVGRYQFGRP